MIRLETRQGPPERIRADALAILVPEEREFFAKHAEMVLRWLRTSSSPLSVTGFEGKEGQALILFPPGIAARGLVLLGIGRASGLTAEKLRRVAALAVRQARSIKAPTLGLCVPNREIIGRLRDASLRRDPWEVAAMALAEGAALGAYRFDRYKTSEKDASTLSRVIIVGPGRTAQARVRRGVDRARIVSEATWLARDLANMPACDLTPQRLAQRAVATGRSFGFSVRALDQRRLRKLGMGGLLGVSQGSGRPPRFIILELNRPAARRGTIVLVGKGVTFDSGGISIKPSAGMAEMKMDMAGAAAVVGTFQAAARLRVPLHLVGLIPATENIPGPNALKPGDILRHYNGMTSEIDNTDAEGRLILADALGYAARYSPDLVIDLATLTGAVVVALGHVTTGMFGNHPAYMQQIKEAGERTYERVWEMPLFDEYDRLIKSEIADVKNVGGRWAGAITAAMFLKRFAHDLPWVHLDIAGTAIMEEAFEYTPKGGSGIGVRLLADFLLHWERV